MLEMRPTTATTDTTRNNDALMLLRASLRGEMITPDNIHYDAARAIWNGIAADKLPGVIVRCEGADDVRATLAYARAAGLPVAVRSGGHSVAGYSTCDGGVVVDLSRMAAIEIDPERRVARIEAGATWSMVAAAANEYGLAITSGDMGSVGVGGLTLGGGIGWMVRKHGLTIDNLRAVELVTADGAVLRASADEHAELFWGLRGGGGNFGVAVAFEFNLHAAGMILGGAVIYDAADGAEAILQAYARIAAAAPDELTTQAAVLLAPPLPFIPPAMHWRPVVLVMVCYAGDLAAGAEVVAPLRTLATPVADLVGPMPYPAMFALTADAAMPGMKHLVRSAYLRTAGGDGLREITAAAMASVPTGVMVQFRVLGGAMARVPADATAFAHRDKGLCVMATHVGTGGDDTERGQAALDGVWAAMRPHADGVYANFLGDEGAGRVRDAYPPATYTRLAALKAQYDPQNLFRLNQNIAPAR